MIEMYYLNTKAKEQRTEQMKEIDRMQNELIELTRSRPEEEEGQEAYLQNIEKLGADIKSKLKEMYRDSFLEHGRNYYKNIEDAFKAMDWPSDLEIEDLGNGYYQIGDLTVQFHLISKIEPMKLIKKEVTVKWILK